MEEKGGVSPSPHLYRVRRRSSAPSTSNNSSSNTHWSRGSSSSKRCKTRGGPISWSNWLPELETTVHTREQINQLVMNYLIVEGYQDVAEAFMKESGTASEVSLDTISERMNIRKCIHAGNTHKAIERVNDLDPEILDTRPALHFQLQLQRMLELISEQKLPEALAFAQAELAPRAATNDAFLDAMEEAMCLFAFPDPAKCSAGHLLSFSHRQEVATELNEAILQSQCSSKEALLLRHMKALKWSQERLQRLVDFPVITDLQRAIFEAPDTDSDADEKMAVVETQSSNTS